MSTRDPTASTKTPRVDRRRRLVRVAAGLVGAVALFALLGFFVAPILVKNKLEEALTQATHRKVTVDRVRVNPFTLSATVNGFVMREPDSDAPFVTFDELFVDASIASLVRLSPVADRVRLTRPHVRLIRLAENRYNVQDLVDEALKPPANPDEPPPRFSLNNIEVVDGRVDFDDRPEGKKHEVTAIRIGIPFISNLPYAVDIDVQPALAAKVNGSPLELSGETRPFTQTRETSLALDFDRIDLPRYAGYSPVELPVRLLGGELDTKLALRFATDAANRLRSLTLSGTAELRNLDVADRAGEPVGRLQRLDAQVELFDAVANTARLKSIVIEQPVVHVTRRRDGSINLQSLLLPPSAAKGGKPLQYAVGHLSVVDGRIQLADQQPVNRPFETDIRKVNADVANLSNAAGTRATVKAGYETTTGATFAYDGDLQVTPIAAAGRIEIRAFRLADLFPYYESLLDLQVDDGKLDLNARVALAAAEPLDLKVTEIEAALKSLVLTFPGDRKPLWRLASADVKGGVVDVGKQRISLGEVTARDGVGDIRRGRDGRLNFARILKTSAAPSSGGNESAGGAGWIVEAELVRIERFRATYEDLALPRPVKLDIAPLAGTYRNFSNARGARGAVDLRATVNGSGRLAASGPLATNPVAGNLRVDLRGMELAPLQPVIEDAVNVAITAGTLRANGQLAFDLAGERPAGSFDGDVEISDFASIDKPHQASLLRFGSLRLGGLRTVLEPLQLSVGDVVLSDFYSRLILNADGTLNVQNLLVAPGDAATSEVRADGTRAGAPRPAGEAPAGAGTQAATAPGGLPPNVGIGRITLAQGNINFSDYFIKPNYSANLTGINGSVGRLTPQAPGDIDLRGTVDDTAPVQISGRINPLSADLFLDIKANARDIELPPLSPYSAKYAGYGIEKGKLSMDVSYLVENRKLSARNRIVLDQLTFGEKVDSPSATKLPVLLAVALLKDRQGVIDIDLPVSGSIDDPEFSLGGVIVRVIVNLITRAVTAPFALIGALVGGGEELSYVEFDPGSSTITPDAKGKLASIAKALADRPALKIDVAGRVDPDVDREGLRKASLQRQVRAQKARALGKAVDAADVTVDAAEYPKYLTAAYRAADFPRPRNFIGMLKELPVPEMEALMLSHADAGEEDLRRLANDRAQRVKNWLVEDGKIAAERVFLIAPRLSAEGIKDKGRASRVDFSLR